MSTPSETKDWAGELLLHGHFSDMTIECRDVAFKVHRSIVCTKSASFNNGIRGGSKEFREHPVIYNQGDTPETMERVLYFLYLGDYDDVGHNLNFRPTTASSDDSNPAKQEAKSKNTDPAREIALNNINVFLAADKFAIPPLKSLAEVKFLEWGAANANSPVVPEVARDVMEKIVGHETKFQEVILAVIYMHIEEHVENPEMLDFFAAFGGLGSLIIEMLVKNDRVKPMVKSDHIEELAASFTSIRSNEEL